MSYRNYRLGGEQLLGVSNCPHCGVASPLLLKAWSPNEVTPRGDGGPKSRWGAFRCTACGHLLTAKGEEESNVSNPFVVAIFPDLWEVDEVVPERVRNYLTQAHRTLASPDASVLMSASSVDAMLKDSNLEEGSLYNRIDQAVAAGLLTQKMADWAHRILLDANNPRHADSNTPNLSAEDAKRAFDFANALTEYLYLLPSRMPPAQEA